MKFKINPIKLSFLEFNDPDLYLLLDTEDIIFKELTHYHRNIWLDIAWKHIHNMEDSV